jgi:hypothetical protein
MNMPEIVVRNNVHALYIRIEQIRSRIKRLKELNAPQDLIDKENDWLEYNKKLLEEEKEKRYGKKEDGK